MTRFLTPEEMYRKKVRKKRLTYVCMVLLVLGLIALLPVLLYRM
ncbi:cytochrome c-type biogenesis protein CcmE [Peribacillus deserti]|uniref:Cytochrome c-type biogenesis protein CcmE n=1 Tax=Peribacillus deserti TaxID=673318 RepID=A0ABS2QCR9_9BACI|nr:hypothetical protein [Peribacillus deserti]MBM7690790.1 cytochrome c-type biogenesis protein CcmE [Peribacillus deserti]